MIIFPYRSFTQGFHLWLLVSILGLLTFWSNKGVASMTQKAQDLSQYPSLVLGMGCFWGAEKRMGELSGVLDVQSGYANGDGAASYTHILAYEKALQSGQTQGKNHAEVVKVIFDPAQVSVTQVLMHFWENHNPTQGDRQGNDVGSNYRSAIYYQTPEQEAAAKETRRLYQQALTEAGYLRITTEIAPLTTYTPAEEYHQDYLQKNPNGYCGLGGTGVTFPREASTAKPASLQHKVEILQGAQLNQEIQLVMFSAPECGYCDAFKRDIAQHWQAEVDLAITEVSQVPTGWQLGQALFATPTLVLFKQGVEVSRYTGYQGDAQRFWQWLGFQLLTPEQQKIAFESGTERPFTGSHLDEKRAGTFVDPITGAPLFRSETKYESGSGWPSFFNPVEGALTLHPDDTHGMQRIEVRSASSGIHLGHVFNDGPPPTYKRYCINGEVLKFIAD